MKKEVKYTLYFAGFLCILSFFIGMLSGCKQKGYKGKIYHEGELIAETSCDDAVFIIMLPDLVEVRSSHNNYNDYLTKEVYKFKNDGKYHIEKKECER